MGFWASSPMDGMEENEENVSVYEVDNDNVSDVLNGKDKEESNSVILDTKPSEESKDKTKATIDKLAKAEPKEAEPKEVESKEKAPTLVVPEDPAHTLVVPDGIELTGDIEVKGSVCVQGTVNGSLKANTVSFVQGKQKLAKVEATTLTVEKDAKIIVREIKVEDNLTIKGAVKGDIVTNSINLTESAVVSGNISANHLNISDSAKIKGEIYFNSTESKDVDAVFED